MLAACVCPCTAVVLVVGVVFLARSDAVPAARLHCGRAGGEMWPKEVTHKCQYRPRLCKQEVPRSGG